MAVVSLKRIKSAKNGKSFVVSSQDDAHRLRSLIFKAGRISRSGRTYDKSGKVERRIYVFDSDLTKKGEFIIRS